MKIGFSGTRQGMSDTQKRNLVRNLEGATEFHHGDCIGADAEADAVARSMGIEIHIHPPTDPKARAFCARAGDTIYPEKPYLDRNHDIVDMTDKLIAAPKSFVEEKRSGTWATIRYARSKDEWDITFI